MSSGMSSKGGLRHNLTDLHPAQPKRSKWARPWDEVNTDKDTSDKE